MLPMFVSGFALAYLLQTYPSLHLPLSICGISGTSIGTSEIHGAKDHPSMVENKELAAMLCKIGHSLQIYFPTFEGANPRDLCACIGMDQILFYFQQILVLHWISDVP